MIVLKVLGWLLLAILGLFLLLLSFALVGPGVAILVFAVLAGVWIAWGRRHDARWRAERGLSDDPRQRWRQVRGQEPRFPVEPDA